MKMDDMKNKMNNDMDNLDSIHEMLGIKEIPDTGSMDNVKNPAADPEYQEYLKMKAMENMKKMKQNVNQISAEDFEMNVVQEAPVKKEEKIEVKEEIKFEEKVEVKEESKAKKENLDDITFNIDEIEIVEAPTGIANMKNIFSMQDEISNSSYQVVCNQSCYVAHMTSLKYGDAIAIANSSASPYAERKKVYEVLYKKMVNCSLGEMTFDEFLATTSFQDVDTLMYGVYQQSFPGETEFSIECKHCGKKSTVKIPNEQLIGTKDEEVYANIGEVLKSVTKPAEAIKKSVLTKTTRKILPMSKIMVDIAIPSLKDHLDLLGSVSPKALKENGQLLSLMLFIKKVYVLDRKATKESGKPKYYPVVDKDQIASLIENLQIKDSTELAKAIEEKNEYHAIVYKITSFPCPNEACKKDLGDMPIDIEALLFSNALQ